MAEIAIREALRQALDEEMERDERVLIMGEEVGEYEGAYKVTRGLLDKYGVPRVMDTPIAELGFTGLGVGAALGGLRPVVEWMTFNFSLLALDQVINNAAKMRHMSGGQLSCPIVFRGPNGPAEYLSSQHSQALQSFYAHVPGIKVAAFSNPYDAKGLLKSAIRDDNPVVLLESEMMYGLTGEVPEEEYLVPIGEARVMREGTDATVISFSKPVHYCMRAAEELEKEGVSVEVIDLRSLRPLDEAAIYASVRKTNRAVVVDEGWRTGSLSAEIAARSMEQVFWHLDAPVGRVCSAEVPIPYPKHLEEAAIPQVADIIAAVHSSLGVRA